MQVRIAQVRITQVSHVMQEGDEGRHNFNICGLLTLELMLGLNKTQSALLGFNWSNWFHTGGWLV